MAVVLDGNTFYCLGPNYEHEHTKFMTHLRGLEGDLIHIEAQAFEQVYKLNLRCKPADIAKLRISYAKTGALTFTDEEGFTWSTAAGADDATHAYSTGVYMEGSLTPKPLTARGYNSGNYFEVPVQLVVNAKTLQNEGIGSA